MTNTFIDGTPKRNTFDFIGEAREARTMELLAWQTRAKLDSMEKARQQWLSKYTLDQEEIKREIDQAHFVRKKKRK